MLILLELLQTLGLGVDILDLSLTIRVEFDQFLASGCVGSLLEVRAQATEQATGSVGDAIGLVGCLSTIGSMKFLVELGQRIHETRRHATVEISKSAMCPERSLVSFVGREEGANTWDDILLMIQLYGSLNGSVANNVAMR